MSGSEQLVMRWVETVWVAGDVVEASHSSRHHQSGAGGCQLRGTQYRGSGSLLLLLLYLLERGGDGMEGVLSFIMDLPEGNRRMVSRVAAKAIQTHTTTTNHTRVYM